MAKTSTKYVCSSCGAQSPQMIGRCPVCGEWGTYEEEVTATISTKKGGATLRRGAQAQRLHEVATYTEKDADKCKKHTHSTAKQAAQIAKLAGAGKLIIGHFSAREDDHTVFLNEAKEVFENTVLAVEKEKIEL